MSDANKGLAVLDMSRERRPKKTTIQERADSLRDLWDKGLPGGDKTGWESVDHLYSVAPGQMTILTGWPSSGKSEWLDALLCNLRGWHFVMCSPENQPVELHMAKLLEKVAKKPFGRGPSERIQREEINEFADVLRNFTFLEPPASGAFQITDVLREAQEILGDQGKRGLVLDPWNEFESTRPAGLSETEYVSQTLSLIRNWARKNKVHVWIVAHPQKMRLADGTLPVPRPDMISGCHDDQTEVLTTRGWVPHADVTVADEVCCFDPETSTLRYERPSKVWRFPVSGEMLRFSSPSYDGLVTPNHRMLVKPNWHKKPSFAARAKFNGIGRPQKYTRDAWTFVEAKDVGSDLVLPWASVGKDQPEYPITDGKLRILGWWIAEGWVSRSAVAFCQAVGDMAAMMERTLAAENLAFSTAVRYNKPNERPMWSANFLVRNCQKTREFTDLIRRECGKGAENKKLPSFTWKLSNRQKAVLLDGLMDGDGHRGIGGWLYTTVSKQLADEVQRLAIEIGRMAIQTDKGRAQPHYKTTYTVLIGRPERDQIACRAIRNIRKERYTGDVFCLTVPTGAYVTRRNGKPLISGNSQNWWNKADVCITVYRDFQKQDDSVQIHIQKCRFKHVGRQGVAELRYDRVTGTYAEKPEYVHEQAEKYRGKGRIYD